MDAPPMQGTKGRGAVEKLEMAANSSAAALEIRYLQKSPGGFPTQ
jgi:hypothetical protein